MYMDRPSYSRLQAMRITPAWTAMTVHYPLCIQTLLRRIQLVSRKDTMESEHVSMSDHRNDHPNLA
jgi:hypothetical protein